MAKHDSLNDPYEGNLVATDVSHLQGENQDPIAFAAMLEAHDKRWQQSLSRYRICSLSNTWKSTLLWAHYADEFRGICIELSTADDSDIYPVKYESMNNIAQVLKCNDTPLTALTYKTTDWEHEEEVRVIREGHGYIDIRVKAVIIGHRVQENTRKCITEIVSPLGIETYLVVPTLNGLDKMNRRPRGPKYLAHQVD